MARGKTLDGKYARLLERLDETALDPDAWQQVCDELAALVAGVGTLLIPYNIDDRTIAMPHSSNLDEVVQRFVETGWARRDFRARGFPKAMASGFVTDQDLIAPDEMDRHPYYAELLAPAGLKWFAGVSFEARGKAWGAAVHGTPARGPFTDADVETLMRTREHLSMAATRSTALGARRLTSLEVVLASAARGVVVLDWSGKVVSLNEKADEILGEAELAFQGRLRSPDPAVDARLVDLVERVVGFDPSVQAVLPRPVLIPTRDGRLFSADAVPMPRDFEALLSGACAIITLHEVSGGAQSREQLRQRFRMTAREAELAGHLAAGRSLGSAAAAMGISIATARHYLKAMFAKTGARRQAELVAVLARDAA